MNINAIKLATILIITLFITQPLSAMHESEHDLSGVFQESCRLKLKFMPPFFPQDPVLVFLD